MTCSSKSSLLLSNIPSSFWLELLVIVSLIFNATFFYKQVALIRVNYFKVIWKSVKKLINIFFKWFNYFFMFKIIGIWVRVICIIWKIYIDIINKQITDENIKKERPRYWPLQYSWLNITIFIEQRVDFNPLDSVS